ncbi:hypothetical protein M2103_000271 [Ereboglobus sp. PH5-5]|nr:hypothetical protein [Ereboglobus sp. PH5-5]
MNKMKRLWAWIVAAAQWVWGRYHAHLPWCAGLFAIVMSLFCWHLFSKDVVYSKPGTDVYSQYIYQQHFLHSEATRDLPMTPAWKEIPPFNLPLWNPYTYGGHSFVGDSQAALFYPPTWFVSFLPPTAAINVLMAFHTFVIGLGLYMWAAWRGLRPAAAFVGGVLAMLGGTYFMHVYAGHMSNLGSMAWAPFVFWGIDGWMRAHRFKWIVLAAGAAALQIYAGHAQYAYYTAITAGVYSLIFLWQAERRMATVLGLLAIYPLAAIFSAMQLLPSYGAMMESVRAGGAGLEFAKMFGLPPENLLTTIAPWFYGGTEKVMYWGRCYLWEMQLYMGVAGLAFAAFGVGGFKMNDRLRWIGLLAAVLLLAFGSNVSALYNILYKMVPFYSSFRGASKFVFFAGLFGSLLAAMGVNRLLNKEKPGVGWGAAWLGLGAGCVLAGIWMGTDGALESWKSILNSMIDSNESYLHKNYWVQSGVMEAGVATSALALRIGGGLLMVAGALWLAARKVPQVVWALCLMAVVDVYIFAYKNLPSFKVSEIHGMQLQEFFAKNDPRSGYRALNLIAPMSGMMWRSEGIWGNEPSVLKRYSEFMTFTQGLNPDGATQNLNITRIDQRLFGLLRCRFIFHPEGNNIKATPIAPEAMGRFYIVSNYEVMKSRDEIFKALANPQFDLKHKVILEQEPNPKPEPQSVEYTVRLLGASTDQWTLEVTCNRATMLVMTDPWSRDWRAVTLPGSVQTNYDVLPANYILRAIPLAQGRHVFRIEYVPWGLATGKKATFAGIAFAVCLLAFPSWRKKLRIEPPEAE